MRGLIEAGVVLFVIYLFLQWEKNNGTLSATSATGGASGIASIFNEVPGSPAVGSLEENSSASGSSSSTSSVSSTGAAKSGGCGCGGAS